LKGGPEPCGSGTNILHSDGSVAGYVHLRQEGVVVEVGETISQAEPTPSSE